MRRPTFKEMSKLQYKAGADPGEGLWGLETPLQKYIMEVKRMMYWYNNA